MYSGLLKNSTQFFGSFYRGNFQGLLPIFVMLWQSPLICTIIVEATMKKSCSILEPFAKTDLFNYANFLEAWELPICKILI